MPSTIVVDGAGDLFVLDTGNHRVQKFGPDGKYLATYGRQGQGPGEFYYPVWLALDAKGFLYVSDPNNQRIQVLTPDGKDHKTIKGLEQGVGPRFPGQARGARDGRAPDALRDEPGRGEARRPAEAGQGPRRRGQAPARVRRTDRFQERAREQRRERGHHDGRRRPARSISSFPVQNRIEKYAADGRLLWRADRELPYSMEIKDKGEMKRDGDNVTVRGPQLNRCASGIAVDGQGPDLGRHDDPPAQERGAGRDVDEHDHGRGRRADDRL